MRKRITIALVLLVVLGAAGIGGVFLYVRLTQHPAASCPNCRSFIYYSLEEYAQQHEGWYPRGGKDPLDSLSKCVTDEANVHVFTSHALSSDHVAYWRQQRSFSPEFCCYRYNEGLREDDPGGLILLYYFEPTRWQGHSSKMSEIGRPVSRVPPMHSWEWMPEAEFQEWQRKTQEYLKTRARTATTDGEPDQ